MSRSRLALLAFAAVALLLILSPAILMRSVQPTLCPTATVGQGRVDGGVSWEITRSDCEAGRTVWQVRVAPLQGRLHLAYDAEGGPEPAAVAQRGRTVTVSLKSPLADGSRAVDVELDHRARPTEPARIVAGVRRS